jgi:hypothetical protein
MSRTRIILLIVALAGLGLGAVAVMRLPMGVKQISQLPLVDAATLQTLPKKSLSQADFRHLGDGVLPPTNSWLSGMALQATPRAVYPMPLSLLAKDDGFEMSLPTVQLGSTAIMGTHKPGLIAQIVGATSFRLTRYDKISATLTYYDTKQQALGTITIAEGSPYVFYRADSNAKINVHYLDDGHNYEVTTDRNTPVTSTEAAPSKGGLVTFYGYDTKASLTQLQKYAGSELTSVSVSHDQSDKSVTTKLDYHTADGQPTLFAAMPYQTVKDEHPVDITYDTIYGSMKLLSGTQIVFSTDLAQPSNSLNFSKLTADHKAQLIATLKADVASTTIDKTDWILPGSCIKPMR